VIKQCEDNPVAVTRHKVWRAANNQLEEFRNSIGNSLAEDLGKYKSGTASAEAATTD
jgi:hypothetical protein